MRKALTAGGGIWFVCTLVGIALGQIVLGWAIGLILGGISGVLRRGLYQQSN